MNGLYLQDRSLEGGTRPPACLRPVTTGALPHILQRSLIYIYRVYFSAHPNTMSLVKRVCVALVAIAGRRYTYTVCTTALQTLLDVLVPCLVAKRQARDGGPHTLCPAARGRSHVLGTRQPSPRDGGSDGGRLLLRQWRHLQRHSEQDCNRCGSSSNHTSTLAYAGRARDASSGTVRRNPTLPVPALLQARSARHGRSTSHSPQRTHWAACRPSTRRSR